VQDYGAGKYGKALYGIYTVKELAAAPAGLSAMAATIGRKLMSFVAPVSAQSFVVAAPDYTFFYIPVSDDSAVWTDAAEATDPWTPVADNTSPWTEIPSYG
jgi:hypothetical protein